MPKQNGGRSQASTAVIKQNKAQLIELLKGSESRLRNLLPKYMSPERMLSLVMLSVTRTPKLLECDPHTVLNSVMQAAQLGLEIGGPVPGAHLVPFYNSRRKVMECQMIPDFRGLIQLAVDTGSITSADPWLVYHGEKFIVRGGTNPGIDHEPDYSIDRNPQAITHAYVVFTLPSGERKFHVMSRQEIDRVRGASKASDSGPWVDWYDQMALKTVIKRGLKTVPMNPNSAEARRLAMAIEADNRFESGVASMVIPEWDSEESLSAEAAAQTADRAEELKERMQKARSKASAPTGRDVTEEASASVEPPADPEPAAEASESDEAAEIDYLQRKLFAAMKEHAPHLAQDREQRRQWQYRLTGHASIKRMGPAELRKLIDAVERGDTDPEEPAHGPEFADDDSEEPPF